MNNLPEAYELDWHEPAGIKAVHDTVFGHFGVFNDSFGVRFYGESEVPEYVDTVRPLSFAFIIPADKDFKNTAAARLALEAVERMAFLSFLDDGHSRLSYYHVHEGTEIIRYLDANDVLRKYRQALRDMPCIELNKYHFFKRTDWQRTESDSFRTDKKWVRYKTRFVFWKEKA